MSKIFSLFLLFALASCSFGNHEIRYCPNVKISPEYSHATKLYGNTVNYTVEIVGYEGYCRYDEKKGATTAVVAPVFEIARYSDVAGKNVEFSYYVNTEYNYNKMMGKQPHSYKTSVPEKNKKLLFTGKEVVVQIPNDEPGYQINLELALTPQEEMYNQMQGLDF